MTSNVPMVRKIAWLAILVQVIIIALLIFLYQQISFGDPFIFAALTYVILAFLLRNIFSKQHRIGILLVKQQRFTEALPFFQKSYDDLNKRSWIDKYRCLTLFSSSKLSYREMALCNMAFCYSQIGEGQKARAYYELALKTNPQNGLAIAGLNMLNSINSPKT